MQLHNATSDSSKHGMRIPRIMTLQYELCTSHFFDSFLPRNDFTARPSNEQQILKDSVQKSASLRNVIIALGALDLTHHSKSYMPIAVAYYKQAVSSLRLQLSRDANVNDATLWTSLLLSLFELMYDNTGVGFMLHFTKGLPALIRERRFDRCQISCYQSLCHAVQMFEVMRAASFWTYTQPALAEDPYWQETIQEAAGDSPEAQEFALLYSLVGRTVSINNVVSRIVLMTTQDNMTLEQQRQLAAAATDGLVIQDELEMWWLARVSQSLEIYTPLSLLSNIFYWTLIISITSIFNFPHFRFCHLIAPSVTPTVLSGQVDRLSALLRNALRNTNLAGILLLWPLRVAGSKSTREDQISVILAMLHEIKGRGFVIAQSFEDVLMGLWERKGILRA